MFPDILRDDSFRLETARLWLRWPQARDVPQLAEQAGNFQVAKHTARIPHPYTASDGESFVLATRRQNMLGTRLGLALTEKSGSRALLGMIGAEPGGENAIALGYWLAESCWGKGLMGEALDEMIALLFHLTPAVAVRAPVVRDNVRSRGLLTSRGFRAAGERRVSAPARARVVDCIDFRLSRTDWKQFEQRRFQRHTLCA